MNNAKLNKSQVYTETLAFFRRASSLFLIMLKLFSINSRSSSSCAFLFFDSYCNILS